MPLTQKKSLILKPLEISCTSSDCKNGLHCFKLTKKLKQNIEDGCCRECSAKLIDRNRTKMRNLEDIGYTFKALKYEMWRHYYWHIEIDTIALNHANRKGFTGMQKAAIRRLQTSVGKPAGLRDGMQTPKTKNVLYYAQHATATCCRQCIEDWHGIPKNEPLSDFEINYFSKLLMLYVQERLPYLSEKGKYVPRLSNSYFR